MRLFVAAVFFLGLTLTMHAALIEAQSQTQSVNVTEISASPAEFTLTFDKYNPASFAGNPLAGVLLKFEAEVKGDLIANASGGADVQVRAFFELYLFINTATDDTLGIPESNVVPFLIAFAAEPPVGTVVIPAGSTRDILDVTGQSNRSLSITDPSGLVAYVGGTGDQLTIQIKMQAIASPAIYGTPVQINVRGGGASTATLTYFYEGTEVPEPSTAGLLLSAMVAVGAFARRRNTAVKGANSSLF